MPESNTPETFNEVPVPKIARNKKRVPLIIAGILGVIVLLAAIVMGIMLLLRDSAGNGTADRDPASGLPISDDPPADTSSPVPTAPARATPLPSPIPITQSDGRNLAVTIRYDREPQFSLSIQGIERTEIRPTVEQYAPSPGAPYSLLRFLDANGDTIAEYPFSVGTEVLAEGLDMPTQVIPVDTSTVYMVAPLQRDNLPSKIQVVAPESERVFDEQSITFSQDTSGLLQWAFGQSARAQEAEEKRFTIVVVRDQGVPPHSFTNAVTAAFGIFQVEPWATYVDEVDIIPISTQTPLNCKQAGAFPKCTDDNLVIQAVAPQVPQWDAIIVIANQSCNCGSVAGHLPPITAVGFTITPGVIVHELGHSIGKMYDEYLYQQNNTQLHMGSIGPNCFASEQACQDATAEFPSAQCSLGCWTVSSWRPATRIMHNTYTPLQFGPLEECIMRQAIAAVLGDTSEKSQCGDTEEDEDNENGLYWGWRR